MLPGTLLNLNIATVLRWRPLQAAVQGPSRHETPIKLLGSVDNRV